MNNIILIPTDFSEVCDNAIKHGVEMARHFRFNILILHVIDKQTRSWLNKIGKDESYVDEKLLEIADQLKSKHKLIIQTLSKKGDIFKTIPEVAAEIEADLILLGTHGKTGMQKITGSYALKVITRSPSPVIVIHKPKFTSKFNKIIFPVDTSYATRQKVGWAIHIAKKYRSVVYLFRIKESSDVLKHKLEIITEQITSVLKKNNISYQVDAAKKEGNYATQVNKYAQEVEADMIMIMTNSKEGFPNFSLGPWDEKIIFNPAMIPVMCINPHAYEYISLNY